MGTTIQVATTNQVVLCQQNYRCIPHFDKLMQPPFWVVYLSYTLNTRAQTFPYLFAPKNYTTHAHIHKVPRYMHIPTWHNIINTHVQHNTYTTHIPQQNPHVHNSVENLETTLALSTDTRKYCL